MSSPSSPAASQTVYSEDVTNQALMSVVLNLRTQLTSLSRRQDELTELVTDLRRELQTQTRNDSTVSAQSPLEPASIAPRETKSAATSSTPSPTQGVESTMEPRPSIQTRPIPAPERRVRRRNAFYHISNAEEAPWKAPGGYHPCHDDTRTTQGKKFIAKRPASPSSPSLRVPDSPGKGNHLPPPYSPPSLRLPPLRASATSSLPTPPPPQERITLPPFAAVAALSTLPILPAPTPRTRPLHMEGAFYHLSWFERTPFTAPGPGIFRPPPRVPTPMPTASPAFLSSPKRKREDVEDTLDSDEASDKKRARRPSTDDID